MRYFGPLAKIIGIDINTKCKQHEVDGIFVRIGDQSDEVFLQSILDEFGPPDIVLDDGSHVMEPHRRKLLFSLPKDAQEWRVHGRGFAHGLLARVRRRRG